MVEKSNEEQIDLDRLNDGISEIRPYKSKQARLEEKQAKVEEKKLKAEEKRLRTEAKKNGSKQEPDNIKIENSEPEEVKEEDSYIVDFDSIETIIGPPVDESEEDDTGKPRLKVSTKLALAFAVMFFTVVVGYSVVAFGHIPFVEKWRNIWIETAMWTDQHQWLATSFFPDWLIKDVMSGYSDVKDMGVTEIELSEKESPFGNVIDPSVLTVGEPDYNGNKVIANDIEEGLVVLEVKDTNYTGKLIIVDDPSRVFLGVTDYKGSRGEFILDYLEKENAIAGMNASGFIDTGGVSLGGEISGQCVSDGEYWGYNKSKYTLIGFDRNNRMIVGGTDDWDSYDIRDGMQFRPTLILNGKKVVEDSAGWGMQPRTTIGQCANGVVLMLVIDGRKPGHSIGATMEECADILLSYGCVTAAACDGGSSSVMGYNGEIINIPTTRGMPEGRYLPNAWLVKSKKSNS